MADKKDEKKKQEQQKKDKEKRSYLTAVAAVSGVALIISFFLPFVRFDERTTQLLHEYHSDFTRAYGRYINEFDKKTGDDAEKKAELAKKNVRDVTRADFGPLLADRNINGHELREIREVLRAYRDFLVIPNGDTAFTLLSQSRHVDKNADGKADSADHSLAKVQVPLSRDVLSRPDVAGPIQWVVLSLLVFGAMQLVFAWVSRFGPYNMTFLVLTFIPGFVYVAFITLMMFAQFWTQQGADAATDGVRETGSVEIDQEMPDKKAAVRAFEQVKMDRGAMLMLAAGVGLLLVALLGPRKLGDQWSRAYIMYGVVVVICVIGIVMFHSALQPTPPGEIPVAQPEG